MSNQLVLESTPSTHFQMTHVGSNFIDHSGTIFARSVRQRWDSPECSGTYVCIYRVDTRVLHSDEHLRKRRRFERASEKEHRTFSFKREKCIRPSVESAPIIAALTVQFTWLASIVGMGTLTIFMTSGSPRIFTEIACITVGASFRGEVILAQSPTSRTRIH